MLDHAASPLRLGFLRRISTKLAGFPPLVVLAFGWIALMLVVGVFADVLAPFDFKALDLQARLSPPFFLPGGSLRHLLGTDELGRDVFSRLLVSIRISFVIAIASTVIAAVLGVLLGFLAAYTRGRVEQLILVLIDVWASMPFMIVALAALAFLGNSFLLFTILLGLHGWERIARVTRGLAIAAQEQGYALAVRDIGATPLRVYGLHILPNIVSTLVVAMTVNFVEVILLESSLSFLGLGIQPPLTSLGNMVVYGRDYIQSAPWIPLAPSLVIALTTLAVSIVGDVARDHFDPTLK